MFFTELAKALVQLKVLLNEETGWLAVAAHGTRQSVPYFRIAMDPVLRHIPEIKLTGAPNIYRFRTLTTWKEWSQRQDFPVCPLKNPFLSIRLEPLRKYWSDYLSTCTISIRSRIESSRMLYAIKAEAEEKTRRFKKGSIVNFPWEVLIATAQPQQD